MVIPTGTRDARDRGGNERAQSEVIGVILMTAIAVVLAAVIGQYVFGLDIIQGQEQAVGPQVSFDTTVETNGDLTIEHVSGDSMDPDELTVVGSESGEIPGVLNVGDEWTAGESITIPKSDMTDPETIRIVWESSTTDDSTVVFNYEYDP